MENLTPFWHGHSGYPLNVIITSGRFRMDFFDDAAVILKHKALWTVQGGKTKTKMAETTQTERLKTWAFL